MAYMGIGSEARYDAAVAARIERNAFVGRNKRWNAIPANVELADRLYAIVNKESNPGKFITSMCENLQDWGGLTDNQAAALVKVLDSRDIKKAEWAEKMVAEQLANAGSQYLGTIGERQGFEVHVERTFNFEGHYGTCYCYVLKDVDGNVIINMGSCLEGVEKGQDLKIKGTVKKHEVRDGVKQTVINRVKVL